MSETLQLSNTPRWDAVAWVVEHNTRDLLDRRFSLASEVVSWFKTLALFREAETERMIMVDPGRDDLRWHKAILSALIADGERLLLDLDASGGLPANPGDIKYGDLQATVSHLHDTLAVWHNSVPKEEKEALLKAVFNVTSA